MGSEGSTQSSSVPSNVEDHTSKPERTHEGQLSPNSEQDFPNDSGADEEVDESRGLPNPARDLAKAQFASLVEETHPDDKERMDTEDEPEEEGNGEDDSWSGALDLPKSAENEIVLPHKGDKPPKEVSLKEGKPWLALKPRRPQEE